MIEARQYVRNHLMPQDIYCYHANLFEVISFFLFFSITIFIKLKFYYFEEWSKRLENDISVFPEMEQVLQPKYDCVCTNYDETGEKDEL